MSSAAAPPFPLPHDGRLCAGISFSADGKLVRGAVVRAEGYGLALYPRVETYVELDIGKEPGPEYLSEGTSSSGASIHGTRYVDAAARVIAQLVARVGADRNRVLLAGVHGPETWPESTHDGQTYTGLVDATRLAEVSGCTIVDDFPSRDLALGGNGGPLDYVALWFLLADRTRVPGRRIRGLVDFRGTVHFTFLPPHCLQLPRLLALEVAPGMRLLREVSEIEAGAAGHPPGEDGQPISDLLDRWLRLAAEDAAAWSPRGMESAPFVRALRELEGRQPLAATDVETTATQLIALTLARKMQSYLARSEPVGELIVAGGGRFQAGLMRDIERSLPGIAVRSSEDLAIPAAALQPAGIAVLALMHLDGIPGNPFGLTGARAARVLGRLTPGTPSNWHQVLEDIAGRGQVRLPLRIAV